MKKLYVGRSRMDVAAWNQLTVIADDGPSQEAWEAVGEGRACPFPRPAPGRYPSPWD